MGLFVYLRGRFECVRCQQVSDAQVQTKLLRHEADNMCWEYRAGDTELMVGLDGYCPLHPWSGGSPLVVAVGDWDCSHCGLNWQWAKAEFDLRSGSGLPVVTIRELAGLRPWRAADLAGVQFVEAELAELSGLWAMPAHSWQEGLTRWSSRPVPERCKLVAAGFRKWCREVAGVDPDVVPPAK